MHETYEQHRNLAHDQKVPSFIFHPRYVFSHNLYEGTVFTVTGPLCDSSSTHLPNNARVGLALLRDVLVNTPAPVRRRAPSWSAQGAGVFQQPLAYCLPPDGSERRRKEVTFELHGLRLSLN